jgi:ketosteroid isomerase-like protein
MADSAEPEVRSTFNKLVSAINAGDVDALGSLMLAGSDCIHIGSDDSEWWNADEFLRNFSNVNVDQGVTAEAGEVNVHVRGDVAWIEGQGRFRNASGGERGIRVTGVFVRGDDGQWKSAQSHVSIPVPNDQIFALGT